MTKNAELSGKLKKILNLRYEPVGIKIVKKGEDIKGKFESFKEPENRIRHCHSVMMARKGESLLMPVSKHACLVGASSMGLVPTPDKVKSGVVHSTIGMFENIEAAANMISQRFELEQDKFEATVVGPLKNFDMDPDVVVIVDIPETLYWLIPASSYSDGNRQNFNSSPFQATCVDATVIPFLTGKMNISLGCYGCRTGTDIQNDEMISGIPYANIGKMVEALEKLYEGPMKKARNP